MKHKHEWEYADTDDSGRGHRRTTVVKHKCVGCPAIMLTTLMFTGTQARVSGVTVTESRRDRDDRFPKRRGERA